MSIVNRNGGNDGVSGNRADPVRKRAGAGTVYPDGSRPARDPDGKDPGFGRVAIADFVHPQGLYDIVFGIAIGDNGTDFICGRFHGFCLLQHV